MKNNIFRLTGIIALIGLGCFIVVYSSSLAQTTQQDEKTKKPKTLREAVSERDIEADEGVGLEPLNDNLQSLGKYSNAVIIGKITEAKSDFTGSGRFVETYYSVQVERVLKDTTNTGAWTAIDPANPPAPLTTPLKMVRIGGLVEKSGHYVSFKVNGIAKLETDKTYVLFLNWSTDHKAYVITGGLSGTFILNDDSSVTSLTPNKATAKKYKGLDLDTLIKEALSVN